MAIIVMKRQTLRISAIDHKLLLPIESKVSAHCFVTVFCTGSIGRLFRPRNAIGSAQMT